VPKVGDGMVTLAIRPFATPGHYWDAFFSVQEEIRAEFDKNSISLPTPTRVVNNKQIDGKVIHDFRFIEFSLR